MTDWQGRARREAAALIEGYALNVALLSRDKMIDLLAAAWLQGSIYGAHATLADAEVAFDNLRAAL